jgi:hypothetical protein
VNKFAVWILMSGALFSQNTSQPGDVVRGKTIFEGKGACLSAIA